MQVPKRETIPGVRKGKHSLLASHNRCKCSMKTTRNSVKVKSGIKVMKLMESLACVLLSRPISPVLFPDFWVLNIPRYFSFACNGYCEPTEYLLLMTPGSVPFGTCMCYRIKRSLSEICHVSRLWISNILQYFHLTRNMRLFSTPEHLEVLNVTGPSVRKSSPPLRACSTRCRCSIGNL